METSRLEELLAEYTELEGRLADPEVHADQARARKLGKRHAELTPIVRTARELEQVRSDLSTARELAEEDPGLASEAEQLELRIPELEDRLAELLAPRDQRDGSDVVLEIKSGEGGEESALFAGDLLRMYLRFAERQGWQAEVLGATESELGGYKDVIATVKSRGEPGLEGVWSKLKFEGGVHRVQRVPVTESQGRVHTSAAGVLVYPEPEEVEVEVDEKDLRVDVYRSSGPGGQSVNTTDSAVRITHLPSGVVVACQNEKSQLQNKLRAIQVLRARLQAMAEEEAEREVAETRRSQVRTVDRSERVRTYNFPENRISDHRINFKAYNLDHVLEGELDSVLGALREADRRERMQAGV
ncbi:peptide chain release factor 1 [Actinopolyspora erythraea]|uniref:Peptide chain release factor 1 n=1 Tax=Actinopolyspora erythraea TaxID=414996 RepID=A0A099D2M0_9ACTN|nr:peptide chain release factor 1 [Actinopolyspora erythraea]ASU77792.1 peptide chain release factor 1 [Actinopolyspora erythraea]KGI80007.1 peptide chain release factor 1 [Actinopolyspora erythraea]